MKSFVWLSAALLSFSLAAAAPGRVVLPDSAAPVAYDLAIVPDVQAGTFTGSVKITLDVKKPTADIALNAADLRFDSVALSHVAAKPVVSFDTKNEVARLHFPAVLKPGRYTLSIAYAGKINHSPAGLFTLDYSVAGKKHTALYTQFENSDARRFLPCWDEPAQKAVFRLTATLPAAEMPLSNMPVATTEVLPGGKKRVHFAASPKMSSYLLFYGQGDFERISRNVGGVDVGVIVKKGDTAKGQYALDTAAALLPFYNSYFGVKYPLPKMDLIAGPGSSQFFSAMENWGAIFYFERALQVDPKTTSEDEKREVFVTIAHEMAHQWFGDLVTMDWWDDLWLNEGFASWMEYKSADALHPDWHIWTTALHAKESAMRVDAQAGTHPVIQHVTDVLAAGEAFDTITYQKGQATIRMLEAYVGPVAFRAGVRNYMKKYAYRNTVTDDLWREIDKVSPHPLTAVAHDFTLQDGVPMIAATATATGMHLSLGHFERDGAGAPRRWLVPVSVSASDGKPIWHGLVSTDRPADVVVPKGVVAIVNAGQSGYFRTQYDDVLMGRITSQFNTLSADDQFGTLNDAWALGEAGLRPMADGLALARLARADMDPIVQQALAEKLASLDALAKDLPVQAPLRQYAVQVLQPLLTPLGTHKRAGENDNVTMLRGTLMESLSRLGDAVVIAEASAAFKTYLASADSLQGDDRDTVLSVVALNANADQWQQLLTLAAQSGDTLEQRKLYLTLASVRDDALAAKTLELALQDSVPLTLRPDIVRAVSAGHPDMAYDFAMSHKAAFDTLLEPDSRALYFPSLAASAHDPAMVAKLDRFIATELGGRSGSRIDMVKATITHAARVRQQRLPEVAAWLAQH